MKRNEAITYAGHEEREWNRGTTHSDGRNSSVLNSEEKEKSSGDHNMLLPFFFVHYFLDIMAGYW